MHPNEMRKREEAAKRYAAADRSDPFAYSRAMSHLRNNVARPTWDGQNYRDGYYDAEETTEVVHLPEGMKLSNGDTSFSRTAYRNVKRP